MLFVEYPKCSTCQKAKRYLEERGAAFEDRPIHTQPPTVEELRAWQAKSGLPLKRFFNTSGRSYQALGLKDRLPDLTAVSYTHLDVYKRQGEGSGQRIQDAH